MKFVRWGFGYHFISRHFSLNCRPLKNSFLLLWSIHGMCDLRGHFQIVFSLRDFLHNCALSSTQALYVIWKQSDNQKLDILFLRIRTFCRNINVVRKWSHAWNGWKGTHFASCTEGILKRRERWRLSACKAWTSAGRFLRRRFAFVFQNCWAGRMLQFCFWWRRLFCRAAWIVYFHLHWVWSY